MGKKLKDKKITIYQKLTTPTSDGYQQYSYKPIHPSNLWAYKRQLSAKEYYAAMALQVTEEMIFEVNWRADLTTKKSRDYFVRSGDMWYDIQRIDTYEGYKGDLKIYCVLMTAPANDIIFPYEG